MSKNIRKILVFLFILVALIMLFSIVKATTVKETTQSDDSYDTIEENTVIIGVTKFTPGTIITGVGASIAGANDMATYISINGSTDNYSYPKMYYYLAGTWFEFDEDGNITVVSDDISSLDIYYVNNELKPGVTIPKKEVKEEYTVFFMDGGTQVDAVTVTEGETIADFPTLDEELQYSYMWVDKYGNEVTTDTAIYEDCVFVAKWNQIVDLSQTDENGETVLEKQSASLVATYYNQPNTNNGSDNVLTNVDDDVYYIDLGTYTGNEENPTTLTINGVEYGTDNASLSVGNNNFIELPVWKIKQIDGVDHILVALPWLCVEALPNSETVVTVGNQTIDVKLYSEDTNSELVLESAGNFSNSEDANYIHEVTVDSNTITLTRGHKIMGVGLTLSLDNENITTSNYDGVIFRMNNVNKMKMGIVTPEDDTFTYATYYNYSNEPVTEESENTLEYKLAIPGKGTITVTIIVKDVVGVTSASGLLNAIDAGASSVTLSEDVTLTDGLEIAENADVTVDLNGSTLTASKTITVAGTLTLKDESEDQSGEISTTGAHVITVSNGGNLTIESGTYDALTHAKGTIYNNVGGTVTIEGGSFIRSEEAGTKSGGNGGNSWYTVYNDGTMYIEGGYFENNGSFSSMFCNGQGSTAKLIISGGEFFGGINTIKNDNSGLIYISGGKFTGYSQCCLQNWNSVWITGGEFIGTSADETFMTSRWFGSTTDHSNGSAGEMWISGGKFVAGTSGTIVNYKNSKYEGQYEGGTVYILSDCSAEFYNSENTGTLELDDIVDEETTLDTTTYTTELTVDDFLGM